MTETGSRNKRESRVNVDLGRGLRVPASANSRQPQAPQPHQNFMQFPRLHPAWLLAVALPLATITACNTKDNPDEIRRRTAEAGFDAHLVKPVGMADLLSTLDMCVRQPS